MVALAVLDQGSQYHDAAALWQVRDGVHYLFRRLPSDLSAALVAVGHADAGIEETQVVVDLGHSAYGGTGIVAGPALVNADGRGEALDLIHVGLLHLAQELASVG